MKTTAIFKLVATICMSLALSSLGQDYAYQFTAPIVGYTEIDASDIGNYYAGGNRLSSSEGLLPFGTLSETVYYDPTANTLQQVGTFTMPTTVKNLNLDDSQTISGNYIPATVSVVYTFNGGNNVISFDTGIQPLSADPSTQTAETGSPSPHGFFKPAIINFLIPFTAACTLTTGGQNYYGSFAGNIIANDDAYTVVSQLTPTSLVIEQGSPVKYSEFITTGGFEAIINAANGLTADVQFEDVDKTDYSEYYLAPVTATAVPEPNSLIIFALGMFGLSAYFFKKGQNALAV